MHTPEPWLIDRSDYSAICIADENGLVICDLPMLGVIGQEQMAEVDANAKLIAAAPEMLAALRDIMDGQIGGAVDYDADRFVAARKALAKATS